MEIQQLKYFMVAAEYEHMTKAANSLHIAQPALSQSIKRLEKELGVNLFIRSGRSVYLSEVGKILQEKILPVLKTIENLPEEIAQAAGTINTTIRVNVLSASPLIPRIILEYKKTHPEIIFRLSQDEEDLDWDVRISSINSTHKIYEAPHVFSEEIYLAVPIDSHLSKMEEIPLKVAKDQAFISLEKKKIFSEICLNYCQEQGFEPNIAFESDSPATVRNLIDAGLGVAFWPEFSWGRQESEKVKLLHISSPNCVRQLVVTQNHRRASPPLKNDFYKFILEFMRICQGAKLIV